MDSSIIQENVLLAPFTSFKVGGNAEKFVEVHNTTELEAILNTNTDEQVWLISYGSNVLISDEGLKGLTICLRGGAITINETSVTADSGVWWDDVVSESIGLGLWGIELLGEIPGSLGASLYINITAYGQAIGNRVAWIDVWDINTRKILRLTKEQLEWSYKKSVFQKEENKNLIILRACLELSRTKTDELTYQKAIDVAEELSLDTNNLVNRRSIIHEARKRAGSLWSPSQSNTNRTVGSFFRNPLVSSLIAEKIMSFDESEKTIQEIKLMNKVHGGDSKRVSAAHVMLAAGFNRGQTWGAVKLHDQNLLKIEAEVGATAQDIYHVVRLIQKTCLDKLGVILEPEARILGNFTEKN